MAGKKKKRSPNETQLSKRRTVELEDGWSVVTRKPYLVQKPWTARETALHPQEKRQEQASNHEARGEGKDEDGGSHSETCIDEATRLKQVRLVQEKYEKCRTKWSSYSYRDKVIEALEVAFPPTRSEVIIDNAICVAVGCFSSDEELSWSNRSMWQLLLFLEICAWLAERCSAIRTDGLFEIHIQEPRFSSVDLAFLQNLELGSPCRIIPTKGTDIVGRFMIGTTFLFNAFLEWSILIEDVLTYRPPHDSQPQTASVTAKVANPSALYLGPKLKVIWDHVYGLAGEAWEREVQDGDAEEREAQIRLRVARREKMLGSLAEYSDGNEWIALPKSFEGHTEALLDLGLHHWPQRTDD